MALFVGVMSGTSMDAVDCALVDFTDGSPRLVAHYSTPWPPTLRERLQTVAAGGPISATAFGRLDTAVGLFTADAVNALLAKAGYAPADVSAIGSHGQTVAHAPDGVEPTSVQLGDGNIIAERTAIPTVSNFRLRDIAAGGQGAPLAPAFHNAVLRSPTEDRAVLNLGGIANVTLLPADPEAPVIGFDTGPANCLMDLWARQQLGAPYDDAGRWAASAKADPDLLNRLLDDPYFARRPPKSTGTQYFSRQWLQQRLVEFKGMAPDVIQATLLALTTRTVTEAVEIHANGCARVLVCGGGARNDALMRQLHEALGRPVDSTAAYGIDPHWMEPIAFAWLARASMLGQPGNLPSVTGAAAARILGTIHRG